MENMSHEEQARREEQMAGGPVSAGASNEALTNDQQPERMTTSKHSEEYNKLTDGNLPDDTMSGNRDLGTVGGGTIPGGSGQAYGGMGMSDSTKESGGTTDYRNAGMGSTTDRGNRSTTDMGPEHSTNTIDPLAQGSLGGRNPGQPQTAMGDQDSTQGSRNRDSSPEDALNNMVDPMTSRLLGKIHQQDDQSH